MVSVGVGVALFSPAGASFIAYDSGGVVDCFAGSDAYLAMQTVFDEWQALGSPNGRPLADSCDPHSSWVP